MFINEISKATDLTKKAIEYYVEQNLISPIVMENGYRNFSQSDMEVLKKVSVLRKLGISVDNIKEVLCDKTGTVLQKLSVQKVLHNQQEQFKKVMLDKLSFTKNYSDICDEIKAIEQSSTIAEKVLEVFPGFFGQLICLHFAQFLNEPIKTAEQENAYQEIKSFLDTIPTPNFPEDLQEYLMESVKHITTQNITDINENLIETFQNPDKFLTDNKEMLDEYLVFKQSEEYKNSPASKILAFMSEFNRTNGYNDIFIPAMKKLSTSYASYRKQMEIANEKFLAQFPQYQSPTTDVQ